MPTDRPAGGQPPDRPAGHEPSDQAAVQVSGPLPAGHAAEVLDLVQHAAEEDGVSPLSEHVMLHLRYGGDPRARNILLWHDGKLAGYGHLDPTDPVEGPAGEMVIDPAFRRRGLGLILGRALEAEAGTAGLRLWAHGDLPAAARLAAAAGLGRSRVLWQMRRSLQSRIGRPQLADGVRVRTFRVGEDEAAWVSLNRRAFSRHPEQGAWTREDLDLREREPWFDADGFFLAERDAKLVGFHWTKIHGGDVNTVPQGGNGAAGSADAGTADAGTADAGTAAAGTAAAGTAAAGTADAGTADAGTAAGRHGHEAIGEVYVVGVDPDERGTGLGRALTLVGLRYLRAKGLSQVMLYVDETNTAAIGLYESLGFTHWDTDVMFSNNAPTSQDS